MIEQILGKIEQAIRFRDEWEKKYKSADGNTNPVEVIVAGKMISMYEGQIEAYQDVLCMFEGKGM